MSLSSKRWKKKYENLELYVPHVTMCISKIADFPFANVTSVSLSPLLWCHAQQHRKPSRVPVAMSENFFYHICNSFNFFLVIIIANVSEKERHTEINNLVAVFVLESIYFLFSVDGKTSHNKIYSTQQNRGKKKMKKI